jgi:hypothetical protein
VNRKRLLNVQKRWESKDADCTKRVDNMNTSGLLEQFQSSCNHFWPSVEGGFFSMKATVPQRIQDTATVEPLRQREHRDGQGTGT